MAFLPRLRIMLGLLEGTKSGKIAMSLKELSERTGLPPSLLREHLRFLQGEGLVKLIDEDVVLEVTRIDLAIKALEAGLDVERVSNLLDWREFEHVTAQCLDMNQYEVIEHLIFKCQRRRYEVDVVGLRKPLILCIDCKHWSYNRGARLRSAVKEHVERTRSLSKCMLKIPKLANRLSGWNKCFIIPTLVTLRESFMIVYEAVPIVPIRKLNSFLQELEAYLESILHFKVEIDHEDKSTNIVGEPYPFPFKWPEK